MKNFYKFFIIILITSLTRISFAANPESQNLTQIDLLKIEHSLESFDSKNLNEALAAIHTISTLPYYDISDLLADMTLHELKNRKNKTIISELLNELLKRADRRQLFNEQGIARGDSLLFDLKLTLESAVYRETRYEKVRSSYLNLIRDIISKAQTQQLNYPRFSENTLSISEVQAQNHQRKISEGEQVEPLEKHVAPGYKLFKDELEKLRPKSRINVRKEVKAGDSGPIDILISGTTNIITDEIAEDIAQNKLFNIIGREDVLENVLIVLSRYKQQNVALLGSKGSGKTSIVELLAEYIVTGKVAEHEVTSFLQDAVIVQTTSGRISRLAKSDKPAGQADAMEAYFHALSEVQSMIGRRIIVFIDELHTLTKEQVEAIKPFIESSKNQIMLIGASTSPEFRSSFKHNEAFLSRLQDIPVPEISEEEILYIFKNSWMKILKARHRDIEINEDIMKLIIRKSQLVYPDKGILRASFAFADDLATLLRLKATNSSQIAIQSQDIYNFIKRQIGLPVDPTNFVGMQEYRTKILNEISSQVFDQERLITDVVDLWMGVLRNESSRGVKVGMLLGRSGTGKTETATQLALRALGSKERVHIIKASDFADADDIKLNTIFGVPGGIRFGEHSGGTLMDWLDDPSKGKYAGIIVIDEAEKASLLFWIRFMELMDTGSITGGDNKVRHLNRHLILLTSNRGDKEIFPPEANKWSDKAIDKHIDSLSEEDLKSLFERILHAKDEGQLPDTILNRIDMYTVSRLITHSVALKIAKKFSDKISLEYEKKSSIHINIEDQVIEQFIKTYDPLRWGARPFVRALDHYIHNAIGVALGSIPFSLGDSLTIKLGKNEKGLLSLKSEMNHRASFTYLPRYSEQTKEALMCKSLFQ